MSSERRYRLEIRFTFIKTQVPPLFAHRALSSCSRRLTSPIAQIRWWQPLRRGLDLLPLFSTDDRTTDTQHSDEGHRSTFPYSVCLQIHFSSLFLPHNLHVHEVERADPWTNPPSLHVQKNPPTDGQTRGRTMGALPTAENSPEIVGTPRTSTHKHGRREEPQ